MLVKLEGPECFLNVTNATTIKQLRDMVHKVTDIEPKQQRLTFQSREIKDEEEDGKDCTVGSYGMAPLNRIYLLLRLIGGMTQEKKNPQCLICLKETPTLNVKLSCVQSHVICEGCFSDFVDAVIVPAYIHSLDPECPECKLKYTTEKLESAISVLPKEKRYEIYKKNLYYTISYQSIHTDEVRVPCPTAKCEYVEIHTKTKSMDYITCKLCKAKTCVYCRQSDSANHSDCTKYGYARLSLEEAIAEGNVRRCPKCRSAGVKGERCNHITCRVCNCEYCYVCLKTKTEVGDFSQHRNSDFATNTAHCPCYLHNIDRYSGGEEAAVQKFHRDLVLLYLQAVFRKHDEAARSAYTRFDIGSNSGYKLAGVLSSKVTTIPQVKLIMN